MLTSESVASKTDAAMLKIQDILTSLEEQVDKELTGISLHILTPSIALALAYLSNSSECYPRLYDAIVTAIAGVSIFEASMKEAKAMTGRVAGYDCSAPIAPAPPIDLDWNTAGLMFSLETLFTAAVGHAFPMSIDMGCNDSFIARCGNPVHGDFQCNNAMGFQGFRACDLLVSLGGSLHMRSVCRFEGAY